MEITIERHKKDKEAAFEYQKRRHEEWTENYYLYRDKVIINRLTQRQSVNVPLMKETIKTILSKIDDAPDVVFEEKGNDKQKEIYLNQYWLDFFIADQLEVKDIIDKKQVLLYGRSWKKFNIADGRPTIEILDPHDVLIDRYVDPGNIESAFCIIHQHIFRTIGQLESNPVYNKEAINRLKIFYGTQQGLIKAEDNLNSLKDKNERLREMGDIKIDDPILGETVIELNENYTRLWDDSKKRFVIYVTTIADSEILASRPLEDILNINFFPFTSWADDIEKTDFYSDGIADIVRTPNKILNVWFSQLTENRTLRNFGMNFYDATAKEGWAPQSFEATPFGWYPLPGKPNEVFKSVEIPDLSESINEMNFIISMNERATAATATEKGTREKGQITLGEIELMAAKSNDRITSMAKFYRLSWRETSDKWMKLVLANLDKIKAAKLYKKSFKGNYFEKSVGPKDWESKAGYEVKITSSAEQEQETLDTIQKFNAVVAQFPNNVPLKKIYQKKLLDLIKVTPEEQKEVLDFESQTIAPPIDQANMGLNMPTKIPTMAAVN